MELRIAGALALLAASSAHAEDFSTATPIAGNWVYAQTADGSEAVFTNASGSPQLWVHCTRATRRVTISRPASAAASAISVWTTSLERSVATAFSPATGRLTTDLANYDPLLDVILSSRGRFVVSVGTAPPLILPPWAEIARVVEDCRV